MGMFRTVSILVTDDNRQMRALVRSMLKAFGFNRIVEADNVEEALDIMRVTPVDLVLTDLAMKPMDGVEFARLVRTAPDSPNPFVSIIMMTGHSDRVRVGRARDAGVNSFLVKPVSAHAMLTHITKVVNDTRPFVRCPTYFGPDRRVAADPHYRGPLRRASDGVGDDFDLEKIG
jgi:CheY-like chemotaxis protein